MPLLDRARFLAILSRNLDEFFQVRVGALEEQVEASVPTRSVDGLTASEQLREIRARVQGLMRRQEAAFAAEVVPRLAEAGIAFVAASDLNGSDREHVRSYFEQEIFPVLTPLAVDPAHPFPYISNLSLNLAVTVRDPVRGLSRFARVKVPPLLPRFVPLPDGLRFIPVEQVIAAELQSLFRGMEVVSQFPFRITRDADIDLVDDEAEDLLEAIQIELRRQRRGGSVVRLEVDAAMPDEVLGLLARELELAPTDVYPVGGLLDLTGLFDLYGLDRPELKEPAWTPTTPGRLTRAAAEGRSMFDEIGAADLMVHHPYDSFTTSVEAFIGQAAADPRVLAIKQTLYRTSGPSSHIAQALVRAAEAGKQVVALIELRARGDEQANIAWAEALEESGVHVVYGVVGLKTHAKLTLVVRHEEPGIRNYVHIGTGNYNLGTAHIYEDIGLFSADPALGADVAEMFNLLTGYSRQSRFRKLLVAPSGLRTSIVDLIRGQARPDGRIVIKVNNLIDEAVIEALYAASVAGAEVDLIVRGICGLRPGVPGMSERIRVRSIVGRFLEHSRIFLFGAEAQLYLGSSDLMHRNLDRRVEAVAPIEDPALRLRMHEILTTVLADDVLAWELRADGTWFRVPSERGVCCQRRFQELAVARAAQ